MASSSDQPNGVWPITSRLYPGMPRSMSDQPAMTASGWPFSRIATPSPSSNHRACSADPLSDPRPPGCLIRLAGISGVRPASSRA